MALDLEALRANYQPISFNEPPKAKTRGRGGPLSAFISEAGGAGGALGGAALGTAILPGVGTLAGALLGGFLGGTGGKAVEQKVRDNQNFLGAGGSAKSALTEGAISGIMGAGPLRLAKGALTAGTAATLGKQGLFDAINTGASKSVAPSAFKAAASKRIDKVATDLTQRSLKLNDSGFSHDFTQRSKELPGAFARRFGIHGAGDIEKAVTNAYQPGQQVYSQAVEAIGDIPKSDVLAEVQARVAKGLTSPINQKREAAQRVLDEAKGILDNVEGDALPSSYLNEIKSQLSGLVKKGVSDGPTLTSNEVLQTVGDALRSTINKTARARGVKLDQAQLKALGYKSKDVGQLGEELHNFKTLLDKAGVKSHVGSGSSPIGLIPTVAAGTMGGPGGLAAGITAQAINSNAGRKVLAKGSHQLAGKLANKARAIVPDAITNGTKDIGGIKGVGTRVALGSPLAAALNGQSGSNMPTTAMTNMTSTDPTISMDTLSQNTPENASATDPFNPANVAANVQQMVANGASMKDVAAYLDIAKSVQDMQAAASPGVKPLNATQIQQANNAVSGLNDLQNIAQAIQQNPGIIVKDAIPGGSIARGLTGTTDYDAAKQNVVDVISRLRSGAAITQDEANRYMGLLPKVGDSPQSAMRKLERLQGLLSGFANPQPAAADQASVLSALGL